MSILPTNEPFYKNGLHFSCTGCGACCSGTPGYVWVTPEEIAAIASFLNISAEECVRNYIRIVNGHCALLERPAPYDCIFLKNCRCSIYEARPIQCRTYPWWPGIIDSEENWNEERERCEGICDDAPLVPASIIEEQLAKQKKNIEKL